MKRTTLSLLAALTLGSLLPLAACADDLQALTGKWVADRKDDQGRAFKQILEIKQDKFTFKILRDGDELALYAKGEVKAEQAGPFKVAKFFKIEGGRSADDLQPVDDDRSVIYILNGNELTTAVNFDKEREEPPTLTKYKKSSS